MPSFLEEIRGWLDTETRALLSPSPPGKLTAVGLEFYSLLLLRRGSDQQRTDEIIAAIQKQHPIVLVDFPFVVAQEMTLDDALAGQFALACCDCISAFVRDEVIAGADRNLLQQLNQQVTSSAEFEMVTVTVQKVPNTEEARRFCWQFLGLATGAAVPLTLYIFRKKARLMEYWARKSGVELRALNSG